MNILHVHESIEVRGGAEVYISQLQSCLEKHGVDCYWISINVAEPGFLVNEFKGKTNLKLSYTELQRYIDCLIREKGIDLINIHALFDTDVVQYLLQAKPVIKFSHSPIMVCPGRDKFWRYSERICHVKFGFHCFYHIYSEGCANRHPKRILNAWRSVNYETKIASRRYRKIIAMSNYIKAGLLECDIAEDKVVVNPYFTARVPISDKPLGEKRILFIGRLVSSKGPHVLISSLANLVKNDSHVFIDIVGDGLMMKKLKEQIWAEGLDKKVIFHGWLHRDPINELIDRCYMLAFPSIYPEAFGIVGIEAMMHGKPVVGFDVGGVSTWLKDGVNGFLVKAKDERAMAEMTELLLRDEQLHEKMSSNAREMALDYFTEEVHIEKLLQVYEEALHES